MSTFFELNRGSLSDIFCSGFQNVLKISFRTRITLPASADEISWAARFVQQLHDLKLIMVHTDQLKSSDLLPSFWIELCIDAVVLYKSLQSSLCWIACHEKGKSFINFVLFGFDPSHCFDVLVWCLVAIPFLAGLLSLTWSICCFLCW